MSLRFNSINNFDNIRNSINRGRAQRTMRSRAWVNTGRDNRNTRRNRNSRHRASRRQRATQHGMTPNARARLGLSQRRQVIRGVETIYIDWGCREELVKDVRTWTVGEPASADGSGPTTVWIYGRYRVPHYTRFYVKLTPAVSTVECTFLH